jgi:hypothetical protein
MRDRSIDPLDQATDHQELMNEIGLKSAVGKSPSDDTDIDECDCGEPLVGVRRKYGTCIECATLAENKNKRR